MMINLWISCVLYFRHTHLKFSKPVHRYYSGWLLEISTKTIQDSQTCGDSEKAARMNYVGWFSHAPAASWFISLLIGFQHVRMFQHVPTILLVM